MSPLSVVWRSVASLFMASLLTVAGCDNTVVVQLMTGAQSFEVSASALSLPPEWADGDRVASIPCTAGACPSLDDFTLECVADLCDPAPRRISVPVGDVVDFDVLLREASTVLRFLDAIEVTRVAYAASPNSFSIDIPDVDVFWGPDTAAGIDAPGVARLGVIPGIAASTATSGDMILDPEGVAQLSDYVVAGNRRVRFFAQTPLDLTPGGPLPSGGASMTVNLTVRAVGRILD